MGIGGEIPFSQCRFHHPRPNCFQILILKTRAIIDVLTYSEQSIFRSRFSFIGVASGAEAVEGSLGPDEKKWARRKKVGFGSMLDTKAISCIIASRDGRERKAQFLKRAAWPGVIALDQYVN